LTLLLGRVSFSRSGHHIPSKCNEPRSRGHASYARVSGIRAEEPKIAGKPVCSQNLWWTDSVAVEEVSVHCLQKCMPRGVTITEIPLSQRAAEMPERFQVSLTPGGMSVWSISYHQSTFEET
jgi:hypothetical protein